MTMITQLGGERTGHDGPMTIRTLARHRAAAATLLGVLGLAACGSDGPPERLAAEGPATSSPASPSAEADPTTDPSAEPSTDGSPTAEATPKDPPAELGPPKTDLPEDVLLPGSDEQERGVQAWQELGECVLGTPPERAVAAMATTRTGDGEFERQVPVQQVVVLETVKDAVAEAGRLQAQLASCAGGAYASAPVAVGAQGQGLAFGYQQLSDGQYAFGNYLVTTRRGNAVTLLTSTGGEGSLEGARQNETARAQQAWDRLCVYERTDGC